jgi:CRISPR-associated protein Cas1
MKAPEPLHEADTVYIKRQGTLVGTTDNRITVRDVDGDDGLLDSFPVEQVTTINVFGGVAFTTGFTSVAHDHRITLNYFSTTGTFRGRFLPHRNTVAAVRRAQYAFDDDATLELAGAMIQAKMENAIGFLRSKGVAAPQAVHDGISMADDADSQDTLRGAEGMAARAYFESISDVFIDGWNMEGRSTRPPEDHLNSLLSLTYVFLTNEVEASLHTRNLDPHLGIFHADRHGRPSLALDLVEEFRHPFGDRLVARLLNQQILSHDSFGSDNRLIEDGFETFLGKYDEFMSETQIHPIFEYEASRRQIIRLQATLLRKRLVGELDGYHPYLPYK